ncbi:MAG: tRNA threonylcarbamoyladenosine biosynthesis protein TsaB [Marivirga sp.]|jgi:tRNA threonylcarbamoyladenosine biosynthesis protein TsaB
MSIILSIETSTSICSVAIHHDGSLVAECDLHLEKSHSGSLNLLIEQLLTHCDLSMGAISAIAVSSGPGSYTGLRIGMSTAKGLCYALEIPLIGVSSLDAMAKQVIPYLYSDQKSVLVPMIDARRMEVYYKCLDAGLKEVKPLHNLVLEKDSFDALLEQFERVILFGNGSEKALDIYSGIGNLKLISGVTPKAKHLGYLAAEKFVNNEFESLAYFEPSYGKEFYTPVSKKKPFVNFKKD